MLSEYPKQFLSMLSQVLLGGEKVIYLQNLSAIVYKTIKVAWPSV